MPGRGRRRRVARDATAQSSRAAARQPSREPASPAREADSNAFGSGLDAVSALTMLRTPGEPRAAAAQSLSRLVGNRQVARLIAAADRPALAGATARRDDGASTLEAQAEEIYESLNWTNDVGRAMRALRAAHPNWEAVQTVFREEHGSIWEYLTDQLSTEEAVDAYANFMHGHTHDLHVALARAILPTGTRDAEIHRILGSVPAAQKARLAEQYDRDYNDLGEGTLRDNLIGDQSGWELEKSLALLDHDLNEAEHLYFDSVAITGTHTESVISRLQRIAGDADPNKLAQLETQWNTFVAGTSGWGTAPPAAFTDMNLRDAMASELSGEDAGLALAAIDHGRQRGENAASAVPPGMEGAPAGAPAMSDEQILADERIRLQMHEAYINAAAEGAGTNEQQIFDAVDAIRQIWSARISRAETAGDTAKVTEYRAEWEATQNRIRPIVNDEMDEAGVENLRVRLLLAGSLTAADKLYLAQEDFDRDAAVRTVTEAWAAGEINALRTQASEARLDAEGRTLRPSFNPGFAVPVTSGMPFRRIMVLLNEDWSDIERGAQRLKLELDDGTADSDCQRAHDFLRTPGVTAARRMEVIRTFVGIQGLGEREGGTPERKFLNWLGERYENSTATWAMRDLVDPTSDPQELLARAQGRHAAASSGILDQVVTDVATDWGHLTGEDTVEVEQEALSRLEFIVNSRTSPDELQAMMALTGKSSVAELASLQYDEYLARLEELRALKATIAEGLATAVEVLAAAALTVATAGAAGGALVAAVGSAIAGMIAREMMQGTEYELFSEENARQLLVTAVTAGVGEFVGPAVRNLDAINRLGSASAFVRGALTEGTKAVTNETLSTIMADRMPTVESLSASALRVLGNSLGGGVSSRMTSALDDVPIADRIIPSIQANIASSMVSGTADQAASLTTGTGDLTAVDIGSAFARRLARSLGEGTLSGLAEVGAAAHAESRARTEAAGQAGAEQGTEPGPGGTREGGGEEAAGPIPGEAGPTPEEGAGGAGVPPGGGRQGGGGGGDDEGGPLFEGLTDEEIGGALGSATSGTMVEGAGSTEQTLLDMQQLSRLNDEVRALVSGRGVTAPPEAGAEFERSQTEVDLARRILANPQSPPEAINQALAVLVERAVADFRARHAHASTEPGEGALTADILRGCCGVGRDLTADSLAALTLDSAVPVTIDRIQATHVGLGNHSFTIVALPDGTRFLIDPTFAQFVDQVGAPEGDTGGSRGVFTGEAALSDPRAAAVARDLLANGMIPLTAENAHDYALALGADPAHADSVAARLVAGEATILRETVSNGEITRQAAPHPGHQASARDIDNIITPADQGFGWLDSVNSILNRLPPDDPARPVLQSLRDRMFLLVVLQPPMPELPDNEPEPELP